MEAQILNVMELKLDQILPSSEETREDYLFLDDYKELSKRISLLTEYRDSLKKRLYNIIEDPDKWDYFMEDSNG
jgi:hypothetical protein